MNRPSFSAAWAAATQIYDPINSAEKVAQIIGGKVAMNILPLGQPGKWTNTCAVRMSYVLNESGVLIPYVQGKTVSGANRHWHFHYVRDLIQFLRERWGKPDLVISNPEMGDGGLPDKKGVIIFEVSGWGDATGHATLWDGAKCYDSCYFNGPQANYRTTSVSLWELK